MSYRAGIVGCGRIGCGFDDDPRRGYVSTHAGAYAATDGIDLVALSDVDAEKLARYGNKFDVLGRYVDYHDMLGKERLDILSVCTWAETHREIVDAAVAAGLKAIFLEKPIAGSLAAADAIVRRCRDAGVLLLIDHQRRFETFHRRVAEFLRAGGLGTVQQITSYYASGIANTGTHLVDYLRFCFGNIDWVMGVKSEVASPNPKDPNIDGLLHFKSGAVAAIQSCDVKNYAIFETNVLGSKGRLHILSHGLGASYEEVRPNDRFAEYSELHPATSPILDNSKREFMLDAVQHLLDCLNNSAQPVSDGEDGRHALELICALRESAESLGRRVTLPLADSHIVISSR